MDLVSEFGEAGFRYIFVFQGHGALAHQRALDQASDYFNDTYHGKMVHLTGVEPPSRAMRNLRLSVAEQDENGLDVHAGMGETSEILFLRPDLVQQGYRGSASNALFSRDSLPGLYSDLLLLPDPSFRN